MKISKKDIQLLIALVGILIAAAAYFLVFTKYMEKADAIENENLTLASEVTRLETLDAKKDTYAQHTKEMKADITEFENRFPADILEEDSIMTVKIMEDSTNTTVASISIGEPTEVVYGQNGQVDPNAQATDAAAQGTAAAQAATDVSAAQGVISTTTEYADSHLYEVPLGISIQCTYDDFKGLIKYIYAQQNRMSVEGVNIGYDASNNELSGNMTLDTYYLLGTEKIYAPVEIPNTQLGVDTIFGNID